MSEITKEDLTQSNSDLKTFINDKFDENEKRQNILFKQLSETVGEHEDILRGKDRTSGMIKKINYLWIVAGTGAGGLIWKLWEYMSL
jgi:hypothetical protein